MSAPGHVVIGSDGTLLSLDETFCSIMKARALSLVGRNLRSITAPADREECDLAMMRLTRKGIPFIISKRLVRDDRSLIWVKNSVSRTADGIVPTLFMASVEPLIAQPAARSPATLLSSARFMAECRRDMRVVTGEQLFGSEPVWDTILASYIAEAEGRMVIADTLAEMLGISREAADRWIRALIQHELIELEVHLGDPEAPKSYQLTAATHERLEAYLARVASRQAAMQAGADYS